MDPHVHMEELMMRKAGFLLALILLLSGVAAAQQTPQFEIFGGYSRFLADLNTTSFSLNGAHVSAAENLNHWFGGVLDFSSNWGANAGYNINTQSIMYGPRFAYRKSRFITPSVHALFGGIRGSAEFDGISKPNWRFALGVGGAIDVRINDRVAIRLVQADYMPTRFLNLRQDNLRVSAGFVFLLPHW